jgi:hypothetical protein
MLPSIHAAQRPLSALRSAVSRGRAAGRSSLHLACLLLGAVLAVELPAAAAPLQQEVEQLLQAIERSGCEFYRNGSWHSGAATRQHLARKYEEVRRTQTLTSAEDFIDVVATRSSASGLPYRVRCPGAAELPSGPWLRELLDRQRRAGSPPR